MSHSSGQQNATSSAAAVATDKTAGMSRDKWPEVFPQTPMTKPPDERAYDDVPSLGRIPHVSLTGSLRNLSLDEWNLTATSSAAHQTATEVVLPTSSTQLDLIKANTAVLPAPCGTPASAVFSRERHTEAPHPSPSLVDSTRLPFQPSPLPQILVPSPSPSLSPARKAVPSRPSDSVTTARV